MNTGSNAVQSANRQIAFLDRVVSHSKSIFFLVGFALLIVGWSMGSSAVASQNTAILRGFTVCGLLVAGGLSFAASALVRDRDTTEPFTR